MLFWRTTCIILSLAGALAAQDSAPLLPLPRLGNRQFTLPEAELPQPALTPAPGPAPLLKPSLTIRPPVTEPSHVVDTSSMDARELAMLEMEKHLLAEQTKKHVAEEAKKGNASALKQLIVMLGPVNDALARSPKPPVMFEDQIALVGLEPGKVAKTSLEQFFGSPLTPEVEARLLDNVKNQMAGKGKGNVEVKVAAWWPEEGVMAVSVEPKG